MKTTSPLLCGLAAALLAAGASGQTLPKFRPQTIYDQVQIGYGVALGDVDGDGRDDIVLADKKQFVWYHNPDWQKHVIAEDLTVRDNVCLAVRDLDGDGKVEIAVGGQWNPGDTVNSGSVHYLQPPEDRRQKWQPIELPHEPTVHRMRWVKLGEGQFVLVVAPLHGRGNRNGQGKGVRLLAYHPPEDPTQPWKTDVIDESMHMTHNFEPGQWDEATDSEELLYIGREGLLLATYQDGQWSTRKLDRVPGGGEVRMGTDGGGARFLATIEPMHGENLVLYRTVYGGRGEAGRAELAERISLDDSFVQGHAIAIGDLLGVGGQQVVAGWRNPNAEGLVGVKLYYRQDGRWQSQFIDRDGMATEDLRLGDLNGDGRLDIVAAGRATHNLKVYWNEKEGG